MQKRTWVTILILISVILIRLDHPEGWWGAALGALAGLSMAFAVGIIFNEIEKVKR